MPQGWMSHANRAVWPSAQSDRDPILTPGALRLVVERPALASFDHQEPPREHPVNAPSVAS